jgi:CheY-like chemotaxis protein
MNRILIVEDERPLSAAYQTILRQHGYETAIACDGHEALAAVAHTAYDLILLDLKMPRMNGLDFLRQLGDKAANLSIIVFSNLDNQHEIDEAFKLGAQRYILKSWASPEELIKIVAQALA